MSQARRGADSAFLLETGREVVHSDTGISCAGTTVHVATCCGCHHASPSLWGNLTDVAADTYTSLQMVKAEATRKTDALVTLRREKEDEHKPEVATCAPGRAGQAQS